MRIAAGFLGFLLCAGAPRSARAEPPLAVERTPGAEACPDQADLVERVERIRGRRSSSEARYTVTFTSEAGALSATIRSADGSNARVLRTEDPSCHALAQASAVALALLIDAEPVPAGRPPAAPAIIRPPPTPAPPPAPPPRDFAGTLSVSSSALFAVVRPVAPVFGAELGTKLSAFRASVGAVWMLPQTLELGPGEVHATLAAATARFCLAPFRDGSLRLDLCAGAWLGVRGAEGRGYTENTASTTTWLGVPLELSLASLGSPFGAEVSAGCLFSIPNRHFTIAGLGPAYASPPVGALISLRGFSVWPWE